MWISKPELRIMFETIEVNMEKLEAEIRANSNNLTSRISDLEKSQTSLSLSDIKSQLQDLQLWREKLLSMVTEKTPTGKQKLTKFGREFLRRG